MNADMVRSATRIDGPNYDNLIQYFLLCADKGDEFFEAICAIGEDVTNLDTRLRFFIGDAAHLVGKSYGVDMVGEFAKRIKRSTSTVYQYAQVAKFYAVEYRRVWLGEPTLSWSHLREAMRLGTSDAAHEILEVAAGECWSVDQMIVEIKKRLGETVTPQAYSIPVTLTYERGRWVIDGLAELDTTKLHNATLRIAP